MTGPGAGAGAGAGPEGMGQRSDSLPPLSFESAFEGGNLRTAVQVYENEYDLFLAPDLNDRWVWAGVNMCGHASFGALGMQVRIRVRTCVCWV